MSSDAPALIETAVHRFLEEVPALKPLTMVIGIELVGGRSDTQMFRLVMPDVTVTKDIAADAKVRVNMRRDFFNLMVQHDAKVADWHEAFHDGKAKATGVPQYMRLIAQVVEKQEERNRLRRARK
ncbi:hypothetical protein GKE82_06260 [Conexibacter sp. W3-3-2]|uniref:Uncharacterized protein n=1 Tax=Paraconexibacter algicola TaxID=2133960 RepID=A0A2T4UDR6_9ACTN|nr:MULTISPECIES: hypothetical protein [Solirubrobacterales]MTD43917.1 hypothetical protein [Conexibacter sp. W3-3-2]PTL55649.1 hypothetical protein C7Y72_18620 [Paraconexibacter algicola]